MGEVYRAEDTRLGREVAIKALPDGVVEDPERLARFEREARVLASLSHPNIAAIHGLEEAEGRRFLVLELVHGEGLNEVIARGSMPWEDAVPIARQLAEGLEAAHEQGVVHRDLKPANVMLTADRTVKVLDFGLAKAWDGEATSPDLSRSPTLTSHGSGQAAILGTAAYMSPEQARGLPFDRRVDVWGFGVTVYELVAGVKAFPGETAPDCMASIIKEEPDWDALPEDLPRPFRELLKRCLEKDPRQRLQAIGEARIALARPLEPNQAELEPETAAAPGAAPPRPVPARGRIAWSVAAAAIALGAIGWYLAIRSAAGPAPVPATNRFTAEPLTWFGGMEVQPSLSPDGRFVTYASDAGGDWDIYLLRVGGDKPINLTADSLADDVQPSFSPDGQSLAFRSDRDGGGIFVMGATGESVRRLTDFGFNPSWSPEGDRLVIATETTDQNPLSRETTSSLWIVDLADGSSRRVPGDGDRVQPAWSPDGTRLAFWGLPPASGQRDVATVAVDGSGLVPVTRDPDLDWSPAWSPDGRYLYFSSDRGGSLNLWRVAIDQASGELQGGYEPLPTPSRWSGEVALARDGSTLVFTSLDRRGNAEAVPLDGEAAVAGPPRTITRGTSLFIYLDPSPDGTKLVLANSGRFEDLFIVDADGEGLRRLTDDPFKDRGPRWSPDGARVVFFSERDDGYELWLVNADGSGLERLTSLAESEGWVATPVWSHDGERLACTVGSRPAVVDTSASRPVTSYELLPVPEAGRSFAVSDWGPDRRILGVAWNPDSGVYHGTIGVLDPQTAAFEWVETLPIEQGEFVGTPKWVAGGRYAVLSSGGDIYRVDLIDGGSERLVEAPPGVRLVQADVSADGGTLFYLRIEEEADLWLARLETPD